MLMHALVHLTILPHCILWLERALYVFNIKAGTLKRLIESRAYGCCRFRGGGGIKTPPLQLFLFIAAAAFPFRLAYLLWHDDEKIAIYLSNIPGK